MSTELANIKDVTQLRQFLAEQKNQMDAAMPPPTSTRIRATREGLILPTGKATDTLEAIVIDLRYINTYYKKKYTAGQIDSPDCWALDKDANVMAPDDESKSKQHDNCADCSKNQWGSDGQGKACKNKIRLALITPDSKPDSLVYTLELAPTSTLPFLKVMRGLAVPIQTLIMRFSMDGKVDYPKVLAEVIAPVPDTAAAAIAALMEPAQPLLDRGFNYD